MGVSTWTEAETLFAAMAHFEEGKTFAHIADVLGKSRSSVAGKIYRINRNADAYVQKAALEARGAQS